jgi:hypothetical protein
MYWINEKIFSDKGTNAVQNKKITISENIMELAELTCIRHAYSFSTQFKNKKIIARYSKEKFTCEIYNNDILRGLFRLEYEKETVFDIIRQETNNFEKEIVVEIQDENGNFIRLSRIMKNTKLKMNEPILTATVISYENKENSITKNLTITIRKEGV